MRRRGCVLDYKKSLTEKGPRACVWVGGWLGWNSKTWMDVHIVLKVASIIVHINEKKSLYMHETSNYKLACTLTYMNIYIH